MELSEQERDHSFPPPPLELSPSLARSPVFVSNPVRNDGELSVEWR